MSIEVTMPVLGLTMEEGTVAEWLKREGEPVAKDEPLLLVEMDKGTVEVPSPASGVLHRPQTGARPGFQRSAGTRFVAPQDGQRINCESGLAAIRKAPQTKDSPASVHILS